MNYILAFLNALPAMQKALLFLIEEFSRWEAEKKSEAFKQSVLDAVKRGDQRALDGGRPSGRPGVKPK